MIVHSHGLGGTKETSPFLGQHWAGAGFWPYSFNIRAATIRSGEASRRCSAWPNFESCQRPELELENRRCLGCYGPIGDLECRKISSALCSTGSTTDRHVRPFFRCRDNPICQRTNGVGHGRSCDSRIKAAIPMSPSTPAMGDANQAFGEIADSVAMHDGHTRHFADRWCRSGIPVGCVSGTTPGDKYELVLTKRNTRFLLNERCQNRKLATLTIIARSWPSPRHSGTVIYTTCGSEIVVGQHAVRDVLESDDRWQKK